MSNALPLQFSELLTDGALRAAQLASLLFALHAAQPAHAQLPRAATTQLPSVTVTAPAIVDINTGIDGSPLTLIANHVDIRVVGTQARVRTTLTWRNDGPLPVEARYRAPLPSTLAALVRADEFDGCGDPIDALMAQIETADDAAQEAGAGAPSGQGIVPLAPGEEVQVTVEREATLIARGDHHRLVLPLFTQRSGLFSPQFSAIAFIDAARPIVELDSATHPVEINRLGESRAQVVIADGQVREGQFLALDFTLGREAPVAALPVSTTARWGGEVSTRIAAR
ncbi:MAG: hypothetical protein MUC86_05090 [Burkholderiaceae bacterium]|jgi:hypothetical protein|nr:hypothetical protein [Burkholderiaceae bacterium]